MNKPSRGGKTPAERRANMKRKLQIHRQIEEENKRKLKEWKEGNRK